MGQAALIPCCTLIVLITVLEGPIEGFFVITTDDLIFEVKGVIHPEDRIIAYLRYVPSSDTSTGFRKVYNLHDREIFLKDKFPKYLWTSESHGRVVQSVPREKISRILHPVEFLTRLQSSGELTHLQHDTLVLSEKLVETTGIEWNDIGLTGSQLVGVAHEDSDIDLVVYGLKACRQFYSKLSSVIDNIPEITRYSGQPLEEHVSFRWGEQSDFRNLLLEIEKEKLLQGLIGNYHFFIRLVKIPSDLDYAYGDLSYQMMRHQKVSGKVSNSQDSIFTPCEYHVECDDEQITIEKLTSFRGRFTEQVFVGDRFEAFGRLELVTDHRTGSQYSHLVLGELPEDYLIPLE
jgi:predicted nucleotidyltransferase